MKSSRIARPSLSIWQQKLLHIINLRPNETERTFLMFMFYTATSMGILWLEVISAALFLDKYGPDSLPWIYIFSAGVGFGLSFVYSWLQKFLPLRRVIVVIAVLIAVPVLLFRWGLAIEPLLPMTIFAMRLWMEAIYGLNDLNVAITANQLFNIREIKRTFPLISSGNLVADVLSGFSVFFLVSLMGLTNVLMLSFLIMMVGAGVLLIISRNHAHAFPDSLQRQAEANQDDHKAQRSRGSIRNYVTMLFSFFVLGQVVMYLIEFEYLTQLNINLEVDEIAAFLGIFSGLLGLIELLTQWFTSSRLIERQGVFPVLSILPIVIVALSLMTMIGGHPTLLGGTALFIGLIILKFFDEWLRYTLVASTRPVLFQPIPDSDRNVFQSLVGGIAEPLAMGGTGVFILLVVAWAEYLGFESQLLQAQFFLGVVAFLAVVWQVAILLLRSQYLELLVKSAQSGLLSSTEASLRALRKAIVEVLEKPGSEADKRGCIEILAQYDPRSVADVLAPRLPTLPLSLRRQSLETMLEYPNREHAAAVLELIEQEIQPPEVLALALRYIWITQENPDVKQLHSYLDPGVDPVVRGTAASLLLKHGEAREKNEAVNTLRQMLTHEREQERVMGCRALGEADYLQSLRLYIPSLLQDESLRVRRALLEAIAATHLEEYYPSLMKALQYKSTREAASRALTRLGTDAIDMLEQVALDPYRPDSLRNQAWQAIGNMGSDTAIDCLLQNLITSWGNTRRTQLRILLRMTRDTSYTRVQGIDAALDRFGRDGVENLINQELTFIGQIYAALLDLGEHVFADREARLLQKALKELQEDAIERIFMLLQLIILPAGPVQAAQISWQGDSPSNRARGIEILDNTLDIPSKRAILAILDGRSKRDKVLILSESNLFFYQAMPPSDRLRYLLDLRYFLSNWALACCFHVARAQRWGLSTENTVACLRHPTGFVREAVLSYLQVASPRVLGELLPLIRNDPNELVTHQIEQLMAQLPLVRR